MSTDSPTPTRPRVFLVDDHHLFRAGVRAELGDTVEVVGEADEVAAAVELIAEREPDVVLLDVHMPDGGGQAVIEAVKVSRPGVRFLALVGVRRARGRHRGHPGRRAGYVTKAISGVDLIDAVHRVAGGDAVFSPRLAGFVLDAYAGMPADAAPTSVDPELDQLTSREREVLRLIARGYTYKEVAGELSISTKTVESHVSAVLRKLQLSTRHQLTYWATERRLV